MLIRIIEFPIIKIAINILIAKILVYSAMKIMANSPLLYSTLNPDTSSDSPSAKSKGVRFVSANIVIIIIIIRGGNINVNHDLILILIYKKSRDISRIKALSKIRDILTSYEIVCATPRKAPSKAYFEFDDHPAKKVLYTPILETHKKYRIPNNMKKDWLVCG